MQTDTPCLPFGFNSKAAFVCGRVRAELEKAGTPLPLADLEIAAIALVNKLFW